MKKIYRFKHNPYPPHPPPFPWPWDVCLEFSKLKPRFEKILDPPPPPVNFELDIEQDEIRNQSLVNQERN